MDDLQAIITFFEGIIDDTMDQTLEIGLANLAKNTLEMERNWYYLRKLDTSQVALSNSTFQTFYPLPDDFILPSNRGIYVGQPTQTLIPYKLVDFEDQIQYQSVTYFYFIDYANLRYALCGTVGVGGPIQFFYQRGTPDFVALTDQPQFPNQFRKLIALKMAMMFFAIDQGDKNRAWDDRWQKYYDELYKSFVSWDARLKLQGQQNSVTDRINYDAIPNMVNPNLM